MDPSAPSSARPAPRLLDLFLGFASISAIGFGGVLPWARWLVVERRGWLSPAEFTDVLALCQFLPGPNVINLAVTIGARYHGAPGALVSLAGMLALPVATIVGVGALYAAYGDHPLAVGALRGLAATASGLVLATALKVAAPLGRRPLGLAMAGGAFVAVAVLRLPLIPTMLVLAPLSIALHWRRA